MKNVKVDEKSFFRMLLGQYQLAEQDIKISAPHAVALSEEIIAKEKESGNISWEELYAFEKAILALLTKEQMECKFMVAYDMYQEIVGDKNFDLRVRLKPTDLKGASVQLLRSQIEEITDDIFLHLSLYAKCRRNRNNILKRILFPMLVMFIGFISWASVTEGQIPPIVYVIVAGSIGGMVSMIRRIQKSSNTDTHVLTYLDLKYDRINLYLAPAYGGVFSVVLLLIFAAQLLTGSIFPVIETVSKEAIDKTDYVDEVMQLFFVGTYPASGIDCAKMIIWSFIAGFAEQFVPDTLDRLVTRSQKSEKIKADVSGLLPSRGASSRAVHESGNG